MDVKLEERCRLKEREWREALSEKAAMLTETLLIKDIEIEKLIYKIDILEDGGNKSKIEIENKNKEKQILLDSIDKYEQRMKEMQTKNENMEHEMKLTKDALIRAEDNHKKDKHRLQNIADALTKEVNALNEAHVQEIQETKQAMRQQITDVENEFKRLESEMNTKYRDLQNRLDGCIQERDDYKHRLSSCSEERSSLEYQKMALKDKIEKATATFRTEFSILETDQNRLQTQINTLINENKELKQTNFEAFSKLQNFEIKLQKILSENNNLKAELTDKNFLKEISDKKYDQLYFERQNLMSEVERIKTHPILIELEQLKEQNIILREVVLVQKQKLLLFKQENDHQNETFPMKSVETQTIQEKSVQTDKLKPVSTKPIKKHDCVNKPNSVSKAASQKQVELQISEADEKRIQNLEKIVQTLKHTIIDQLKEQYFANNHCNYE